MVGEGVSCATCLVHRSGLLKLSKGMHRIHSQQSKGQCSRSILAHRLLPMI